jgi:carbon monoxide dehydrogenase subunit G
MKLENSFEVPAPPEAAWELLMDVPRVIPCMPGATLVETVDDSNWKADMNVKLGPIALVFATDVSRAAADESGRVVTLSAKAREKRGRGGAQAQIESSLTEIESGTRVDIVADLTLSGAVAQYGRGIVQDVSGQLVTRFADCLKAQLAASSTGTEEATAVAAEAVAQQAKPVAGLSLGIGAFMRSIGRMFGRLFGKSPKSS